MKIPYFIPWITDDDVKFVSIALKQRWLTNGKFLQKFEKQIGSYVKSKHSLGCSSATHALHMSLVSLGIGPGDEVIIPTLTFAATFDVVRYCNAKPVLADINSESFNIDPSEIQKRITTKTKAIIVVHYGGQSCDMSEIIRISRKYKVPVIEDCAHALGSTYGKKFCGTIGMTGCFSFYPTKIITTGEGGMVVTNNSKIANKIKLIRSHGMTKNPTDREINATWKYDISEMGYNYRLDEIRASLGLSQSLRLKDINKMRINIARRYNEALEKISGITIPKTYPDRNHIFHLYTIKVEKDYPLSRDELFKKLHKSGIGSSVQYLPLHLLSYNAKKFIKSQFPNANKIHKKLLSLPIYPTMTNRQVNDVIKCLK